MKQHSLLTSLVFWVCVVKSTQDNQVSSVMGVHQKHCTRGKRPTQTKNQRLTNHLLTKTSLTKKAHTLQSLRQLTKKLPYTKLNQPQVRVSSVQLEDKDIYNKKEEFFKIMGLKPKDNQDFPEPSTHLDEKICGKKDSLPDVKASGNQETIILHEATSKGQFSERTAVVSRNEVSDNSIRTLRPKSPESKDKSSASSITIRISAKAPKVFFLFSEPVLAFENPISLSNKTRRKWISSKGSVKSFMERNPSQLHFYLIFLRFKNPREAFKTTNQVRQKALLKLCKHSFSSSLEGFEASKFGNEIIHEASFQILILELKIGEIPDLKFLDRVDYLFTKVFDQSGTEGSEDLESAWEEYKRSVGFRGSSEVVKVFSAQDIVYYGILNKKCTSVGGKKKSAQLNAEFRTLDFQVDRERPVKVKRIDVRLLHLPINTNFSDVYNSHLEIEVEFQSGVD